MRKKTSYIATAFMIVALAGASLSGTPVKALDLESLTGNWYGSWQHDIINYGSVFKIGVYEEAGYVVIHVPEVGLINQPLPAVFEENNISIYAGEYSLLGSYDGEKISGIILYNLFPVGSWQVYPEMEGPVQPAPAPGPICEDLPDLFVVGEPAYTTELLPFDPDYGPGYIDYPVNGETWENQYRSYARRDLIQLVKHATAKVACKTENWDYWDYAPLGLVDMSEADGSIPGSSIGYPGHPAGTHENGNDMDLAYYQISTPDNSPRDIGYHYDGYDEVYHLTSEPFCLDPFRTALLIAYLSEHPHLRVIGVDGQAGLVIENALDILVDMGWIDESLRNSIPLAYEVEDQGWGWFRFHHHHLHVSMFPVHDITSIVEVEPDSLNTKSKGKYITAYLELDEGYDAHEVDINSLALIINGQTLVPAEEGKVKYSDYNQNGIPDLTMKFSRELIVESIATGNVEVALTGSVSGMVFEGTDTIHVIK